MVATLPSSPAASSPEHGPSRQRLFLSKIGSAGRGVDAAIPLLAVLPLVLLLVDPNWIFSDIYNDPWSYFGYFLDLPNHLRRFGNHYFSDRLTVTIPGYVCHRLFTDVAAHYVLHLSLYYLTVFSIYLTLRQTAGRRAAFLAALAMGSHHFLLKAMGWDYCDGFGIAYLSATIYLLTVGEGSSLRNSAFVLAGVTAMATVVANPGYFLFLLPVAPLLLFHRERRDWRTVSLRIVLLAMGGLILVIALEMIHVLLTGRPWTLEGTRRFLADGASQPDRFRYPISEWGWQACWLVFPALMAVWGTLVLALWRRVDRQTHSSQVIYYPAMLLASVTIVTACACATGNNFFQQFFYSSLLLPAAFLTFGTGMIDVVGSINRRQYVMLAGFAALVLIGSNLITAWPTVLDRWKVSPFVLALVPGVLAILLVMIRGSIHRSYAFFALLSLSQVIAGSGFKTEFCVPPSLGFLFRGNRFDRNRADLLRMVAATTRSALEFEPTGDACFWYDINEPLGLVFKAIVCTHCNHLRNLGPYFPDTNGRLMFTGERLSPGRKIIVLRSFPDANRSFQVASQALHNVGLEAKLVAIRHFEASSMSYSMIVMELDPSMAAAGL